MFEIFNKLALPLLIVCMVASLVAVTVSLRRFDARRAKEANDAAGEAPQVQTLRRK